MNSSPQEPRPGARVPEPAPGAPTPSVSAHSGERTFFGQPWGLANLFSVEMWERFSFYGMQGIVLLYMYFQATEGGLGIDQTTAAGIVGAYGGAVYMFAIAGGWVADRLLGSERTMLTSAVLIMGGHIALALVPGVLGLAIGLVLIAVGSGGLKATITNLVGALYSRDDPRRDAGFSIFYMGVNIGGLVGPLLTGLAQQQYGFHLGFGLAAIGMALGLTQYVLARRKLPDHVHHVPNPLPRSAYPKVAGLFVVAIAVLALAITTGRLRADNLADVVIGIIVVAAVVIFAVLLASPALDGDERSRVRAFIPMFIGNAAFWALFQQQFTVVTIYSDTRLNRSVLGWEMPISWVQSFNPFFIIVLAPVFAALWTRWGARQPVTPTKFGVGIILMGAAFVLFLPMAAVTSVPVLWVAVIMLVATLGELMISPVGLSFSTKIAPRAYPVLMVSLYYLSVSLGTALSGSLASFYSAENEVGYFGTLGAITIGIGLVMLALSKPLAKALRGVR